MQGSGVDGRSSRVSATRSYAGEEEVTVPTFERAPSHRARAGAATRTPVRQRSRLGGVDGLGRGWGEYGVSGFPSSWICDTWRVGLGGADHADADDRGGLGDGAGGVPRLPLAARREGPQRPDLPRGAALLRGPQHRLAGSARGIRQLEFRLETLLALKPGGRVRGLLRR